MLFLYDKAVMVEDGFYFLLSKPNDREKRFGPIFKDLFEVRDGNVSFYSLEGSYNGQILVDSYLLEPRLADMYYPIIFPHKPGADIRETIFTSHRVYNKTYTHESFFQNFYVTKSQTDPGEFFPMVYRPVLNKEEFHHGILILDDRFNVGNTYPLFGPNYDTFRSKLPQFELLIDELTNIFKTIEPILANKNVYGHALRNIIILACTEVENLLKSFLREHGYKKNGQLTIEDYWKVNKHLRLNHAYCFFRRYNQCGLVRPFIEWNSTEYTPLSWYKDYNEVKHDREGSFEKATLGNAINSVCAVGIILVMMYGQGNDFWNEKAGKFLSVHYKNFGIIDHYLPPIRSNNSKGGWIPKKLQV